MTTQSNVNVNQAGPMSPGKRGFYAGRKRRQQLMNLLAYVVLGLGAIITIIPFYWMVATSFKSLAEILQFPPTLFPQVFHPENYVSAFLIVPFDVFFRNSAFVSVSVVLGQLFTCSLAGYAFARLRFPGKNF